MKAIIAEDEPLLAASLKRELARAWPELEVVAQPADGHTALEKIISLAPQIVFLDIHMPVLTGLEVAAELMQHEPKLQPEPLIVFVTAHDEYALQAFEQQAFDYVLKPVRAERLAQTVQRLKTRLQSQANISPQAEQIQKLLHNLHAQSQHAQQAPKLRMVQASKAGGAIQLIPIEEIVYFEAADKYVRVLTVHEEFLIRTPIKELLPQLDAQTFWQIHRGTVVRVASIASVQRDEFFKVSLTLHQRAETLAVSRLYAHLFKAM